MNAASQPAKPAVWGWWWLVVVNREQREEALKDFAFSGQCETFFFLDSPVLSRKRGDATLPVISPCSLMSARGHRHGGEDRMQLGIVPITLFFLFFFFVVLFCFVGDVVNF